MTTEADYLYSKLKGDSDQKQKEISNRRKVKGLLARLEELIILSEETVKEIDRSIENDEM